MPRPRTIPGCTRKHTRLPNGSWRVEVTPPPWSGYSGVGTVYLTNDQFEVYREWVAGAPESIQTMLPELTADEREILISGISGDF